MAQSRKEKLNYRCPSCFMRDIDVDLFYDPDKKEYYCLRCNFHGDEEKVLKLNEMARFRYGLMDERITHYPDDGDEEKGGHKHDPWR